MTAIVISRSYKTYEPVSMIPANCWHAVYAYLNDGKYAHAEVLVAFVLTKKYHVDIYDNGTRIVHDEETCIVGYAASDISTHPAEEADNFMGYLAPGAKIPDHMEQRAREYVSRQQAVGTTKGDHDESPSDNQD